MFLYDHPHSEQTWRHDADARELAERDADRRDMQEYPEHLETLRYLAWGPEFADDAGPIGSNGVTRYESRIEQAIRHKLQSAPRSTRRPMQTWEYEQARQEAAERAQWPITCDGSGVLSEVQTDVDQADVIPCRGCPACDLGRVEVPERKPMSSEIRRLFVAGGRK